MGFGQIRSALAISLAAGVFDWLVISIKTIYKPHFNQTISNVLIQKLTNPFLASETLGFSTKHAISPILLEFGKQLCVESLFKVRIILMYILNSVHKPQRREFSGLALMAVSSVWRGCGKRISAGGTNSHSRRGADMI